ncbi:MAG: flagellin, partial [Thermosulfidibacteraceae bacterium]
ARDVAVNFGTFNVSVSGTGGAIQVQESNIFRTSNATAAAPSTTQLQQLVNFYDPDGSFILATPKKLTVWNGSKSVDIQLEATDTLSDVATKIKNAMVSLGLTGSQVSYVTARGTIIVASGVVGKAGEVFFSGDEDVMKAFGFTVQQQAVDPTLTVKVYAPGGSTPISSATIATDTARNVLQGIDIKFTQKNVGVNVAVSIKASVGGTVSATITSAPQQFTLHIVDHSLTFHIGANKNQVMNTSIGRLDTIALGIDNLLVVDKSAAEESIKKLDSAIAIVSSERGKMGAVINRLQKTIDNLNIQKENMTASESRIRDLDMASETTRFTRSQILSQTAIAMLAQANAIPQMVLQLLR